MFKKNIKIPIEVSARHCHLSQDILEKLFGKVYKLKELKQLSQPSDFACQETVDIKFGSREIKNIRVVGPIREKTQIEISLSDVASSGIMPPIKLSGDLSGSAGAILKGPAGQIEITEGLIIAQRHLHCGTDEAQKYKLKNGEIISVRVAGSRPVVFEEIVVRVKDNYKLCMHIDTDEGNAAGINKKGEGALYLLS